VDFKSVVEAVANAIETAKPFSLVRLGDGEGPVLCWPQHQAPTEMSAVLTTWFGRGSLADPDMSDIAEGLRRAVRSADVVGLPTRFQLTRSPRYGMVFTGFEIFDLSAPPHLFVDSGFHWYLQ
jgi:hypothetical protein